jgi:hypothetical protein
MRKFQTKVNQARSNRRAWSRNSGARNQSRGMVAVDEGRRSCSHYAQSSSCRNELRPFKRQPDRHIVRVGEQHNALNRRSFYRKILL